MTIHYCVWCLSPLTFAEHSPPLGHGINRTINYHVVACMDNANGCAGQRSITLALWAKSTAFATITIYSTQLVWICTWIDRYFYRSDSFIIPKLFTVKMAQDLVAIIRACFYFGCVCCCKDNNITTISLKMKMTWRKCLHTTSRVHSKNCVMRKEKGFHASWLCRFSL